jgi:hypothetical protein
LSRRACQPAAFEPNEKFELYTYWQVLLCKYGLCALLGGRGRRQALLLRAPDTIGRLGTPLTSGYHRPLMLIAYGLSGLHISIGRTLAHMAQQRCWFGLKSRKRTLGSKSFISFYIYELFIYILKLGVYGELFLFIVDDTLIYKVTSNDYLTFVSAQV